MLRLPRRFRVLLLTGLCLWALLWSWSGAAQGIEPAELGWRREDGRLVIDYSLRVQLPRAAEDALRRGIPMYFVAQATLERYRWYWRDERVARVTRHWRLAYQPLTNTWRLGIGSLNQSYATLEEAMGVISRTSGWTIAELAQLDADARYQVDFSFRLDTAQLPPPLIVGLTNSADWQLQFERVLRLE